MVNQKPQYKLFYNKKYDNRESRPVFLGETLKTLVSVYPFNVFSSLDLDTDDFNQFQTCYLLVDADISTEEFVKMRHGDKRSYTFGNRELTVLDELNTPFQYALETYLKYPKRVGTWNLTTWIIHEKIRSDDEFEAMSKILKLAYNEYVDSPYYLSISFDESVIRYLPQLVDLPKVKFGDGGYFDTRPDTFLKINNLSVDQLTNFIFKYVYDLELILEIIMRHPLLGEKWFFNQLTNKKSLLYKRLNNDVESEIRRPVSYSYDVNRFLDIWFEETVVKRYTPYENFFNSSRLEKSYQNKLKNYNNYIEEHENDQSNQFYDEDDDDYYGYFDYDEPEYPTDRRLDVLRQFKNLFGNLVSEDTLKQKFVGIPDVLWGRLEKTY